MFSVGSTEPPQKCTQCQIEFGMQTFKYHCKNCQLLFCNECTQNRCIIPQKDPSEAGADQQEGSSWFPKELMPSSENDFRKPQRVCYSCYYSLRDQQAELRQAVSRANQETEQLKGSSIPNLPSAMDFYLEKEIQKAAVMVEGFKTTVDGQGIPRRLLAMAKGVVFFTIVKLGFVFTGRYGTGLIVAKLADGRWSAPSAVQMSGVGWGLQIGAELTTVMLILTSESAVNAFKSHAQISVGAELGVSVGPIGRSLETDVSAGQEGAAHAFSYAQSKGLFVGASLEASGIASRSDVNRTFYGEDVSINALLQGEYPSPRGAEVLYSALNDLILASEEREKDEDDANGVEMQMPSHAEATAPHTHTMEGRDGEGKEGQSAAGAGKFL